MDLEAPYAIFKNISDSLTVIQLSYRNESSVPHKYLSGYSLMPGEEVRFDFLEATRIYYACPDVSSASGVNARMNVAYFEDDGV